MALFECISDFVDSKRDRRPDATDRILLLKPNYTEAVKREQQTGLFLIKFTFLFFYEKIYR